MNTDIKTYGPKEATAKFSDFIAACQQKAIEIDCNILEVRVYGDYAWAQAAFLVDKFGGIAALVNFHLNGKYTGSAGATTQTYKTIEDALAPVADAYKAEEKARENLELFNCD